MCKRPSYRGLSPFDHTTNPGTKRQTKQYFSSQGTQKNPRHVYRESSKRSIHAQKVHGIPIPQERRMPHNPTQAYLHLNKVAEFVGELSATIPYGKRVAIGFTKSHEGSCHVARDLHHSDPSAGGNI
jgi:hypothetical protein